MFNIPLKPLVLILAVFTLGASLPLWAEEIAVPHSVLDPVSPLAPEKSLRPQPRPLRSDILSPDYRSPIPGSSFSDDEVGNNCQIYIRSDGTYGEHGLMIRNELLGLGTSSDLSAYFFDRTLPGMDNLCPDFYEFTREQKINFWIWFLMSLSHDESKCNDPNWRVNTHAPNGVAAGEFQLDESWRSRSWRGPGCNAHAPREQGYLMVNPANNIPCAVQSLGYSLCGFYSSNAGRCTENGHAPYGSHLTWAKLRRSRGAVINRIKEFPLCR